MNNIGLAYVYLKNTEEAKFYFQNSLQAYVQLSKKESNLSIAQVYKNMETLQLHQ